MEDLAILTGNRIPRGIGGGYGGGGGGGELSGETEPGSYYTYGQNEARRQGQLSQANADMADAQDKGTRLKASGYGTATADLLNQGNLDATIKGQENQLNIANTYADARNVAAQDKVDANAEKQVDRVIDASYPTEEKYLKAMPAFEGLGKQGQAEVLRIAKDVYAQARAAGKFPRWEDLIADIKAKYQ